MANSSFTFKQFSVQQHLCAMKVGTDGVLLGAWAEGGARILDIGTGTGLIALMMAQRFAEARVSAIDVVGDACRQASANVAASAFAGRISVSESSAQEYSPQCRFDSIVSNPPFFVNSMKAPDASRAVARHSDTLSYADLFACVVRLLTPGGVFSAIIPAECLSAFVAEAYMSGLSLTRRCAVRTTLRKQPKRYLLAFRRESGVPMLAEEVVLQDADGGRSEWYRRLTDDFYIK